MRTDLRASNRRRGVHEHRLLPISRGQLADQDDGDAVSFEFQHYDPTTHAKTSIGAKHAHRTRVALAT